MDVLLKHINFRAILPINQRNLHCQFRIDRDITVVFLCFDTNLKSKLPNNNTLTLELNTMTINIKLTII